MFFEEPKMVLYGIDTKTAFIFLKMHNYFLLKMTAWSHTCLL